MQHQTRQLRTLGSTRSFALMSSSRVSARFVICIGSLCSLPMGLSNSTPA